MPMEPKDWIDVTTEKNHYSLDHFVIPKHYEQDVSSILIPHGVIMDRIQKLARLIVDDATGPLVVCCILKGGHQYFADLVNYIKALTKSNGMSVPLSLEFIRVKSYKNDQSEGVTISLSESECKDFAGKNLLIVEDIIDTGNTMVKLLERLKQYNPKSVKVTSLLVKKTSRSNGYVPDYVGFAIPDAFVVGYALDYNEYFRDLDHICVISDHGKQAYAI
ncbi:hypoxanthine-guanine phosphoribosyltransferase [Lichtheimia corymbifera JMRC:FSU:9682]|uniref:Hypoxanthine phosphoribosyltransferase n=2 Tax=Lichtheimia TaxID=688353 RepID=A0A068RFG7_9FUNG|nr:hypoxanthine-guanine phosphoribosyltransferase [Lichtheimia corymbifera JMRC:FSU:9682]CDS07842.1 Putative Hypoxanthinephosphoribosyltransferase [Lichtheimia ramosa]